MKFIGTTGGKPIFHDPDIPEGPYHPGIEFTSIDLTGFTRRTLIVSGEVVRDERLDPATRERKEKP